MASFQKRGKTWQYTISRMVNGKPDPIRKSGYRTKAEAQAAAAEIEQQLRKGLVPQLKPELFEEYFEEWIKVYKSTIEKNTKARYETTLETIKKHFSGVFIQDITKRSYQAFLNEYGKGRTKNTVRKLNSHIRACVKDAIDEGILHIDFTRKATITGDVPAKKPDEKHLNYFESKRLARYLYDNLNTLTDYLLLLGLTSGMRFAELVGLTKDDFDFKNNTITINKTWGYTKKMHTGFGSTKNKKSRVIVMNPKLMNLFKALFEKMPEHIHGLVFFSPRSKYQVISNGAANKALKQILTHLNIETISVHGLRHTHASVLLYKKFSVYYVAERLGDDVDTINEYYAHIIKELRKEEEEKTTQFLEAYL